MKIKRKEMVLRYIINEIFVQRCTQILVHFHHHGRAPLRCLASHNQLLNPPGGVETAFSKSNFILYRNGRTLQNNLHWFSTKVY